jgi:hypothetical protein
MKQVTRKACDLEDGGNWFLRNIGWLLMVSKALYPKRANSSEPPVQEPKILQTYVNIFVFNTTICVYHFYLNQHNNE